MDSIYSRIRDQALIIASQYPPADFYQAYADEIQYSVDIFIQDALIIELRDFVQAHIENDFGHGMDHAHKVAVEAGALVAIECKQASCSSFQVQHLVRMAHCAGLFHDIRRKEQNHARKSADFAAEALQTYDFADSDLADICIAIRNHEAFKDIEEAETREGAMLSDCLYDADKFRWGPENFTQTVWDMVAFGKVPFQKFIQYYPKGVSFLDKIKPTFRSATGRICGPQFIDLGLAIGRDLYGYIQAEFPEYFA
ncbi:MAG: hypothetical protein MUE70_05760 [Desulfobacterales bacterium]|jgi:hypothetical protein|nr:hypothetical protein [Desulfobacterales bacterium]